MRKRIVLITPILLALLILSGCAGLQAKYEKATEDEKARIIISQTQKSLAIMFKSGMVFAEKNPSFMPEWKGKILPSISAANKIVGDLIQRGKLGEKFTPTQVLSVMGGRIGDINAAMNAWGIKLSYVDSALTFWGEGVG